MYCIWNMLSIDNQVFSPITDQLIINERKCFAKILNLFLKKKINPMIGAAGISAFPMSGRVVHKLALKEDPTNFLLMQATGVNVSGQIASVIAGGLILNFFLH